MGIWDCGRVRSIAVDCSRGPGSTGSLPVAAGTGGTGVTCGTCGTGDSIRAIVNVKMWKCCQYQCCQYQWVTVIGYWILATSTLSHFHIKSSTTPPLINSSTQQLNNFASSPLRFFASSLSGTALRRRATRPMRPYRRSLRQRGSFRRNRRRVPARLRDTVPQKPSGSSPWNRKRSRRP